VPEPSQREINRLLRSGVMWSILWLMGVGSLIALLRGLEARRLLLTATRPMQGVGGAWWCIISGTIGLIVWIPIWLIAAFAH
jgi:hypothetical protein